ncbi:TetR/AcrR family transcriptional regulator [Cryptosporangium phraense]|uniref:TetR/AcrR family transcriptional regulator n=1 Tax=Cryptosporangium phraense TaxID=2593070 RepID=A0A545ATR6_9ACTN|nr:TetR/AcrR family transcriptional regulator [Cryptosporangium phraense]TQS43995.1 TetR/AcrR family transcriptional regulator [Cryptosporangium phraense]
MAKGVRLTADDWADEALRILAERGLAGIAVEPLAVRLGTTKGSFYWHFANRDALVEATLARWESRHTAAMIADVDTEAEPVAKLRRLFTEVMTAGARHRIELALLASIDDPRVSSAFERVTARRLAYIASVLETTGFPGDEARRRAQLAYSVYLGHLQLRHTAPGQIVDDSAYRELVLAALLKEHG